MVIKKQFLYQMISCMICVCMIAGLTVGFPSSAYANDAVSVISARQGSDISAHWAENHIRTWLEKGLIKGFPDGTFGPDKAITRAEFMALVNRAYGFVEKSHISFTDVSSEDWFYDEVAKAVAAGYISGYTDGTVKPKSLISRQEAAMILSRLMKLAKHEDKNEIAKFSDYSSMPDWSKDAINSVVAEGYMKGNPNGTFMPIAAITRAETVVTLSRSAGEIYHLAGTYDEDKTFLGNATINTTGVTLENVVIEGNLFLTPGIGEGTVVLRNVTVKGKTTVAGGGKNSVIIDSCDLNEVVVTREDGIVRLSTQGNTTIKILVVEEGAIIDSALLSESGDILIVYLTADERVELSGDFGTIHIVNPETVVDIINGSIENLIIDETASGSLINLSENATVNNMDVNAPVQVTGMGTIETAVIGEGAEETTFEKEPIIKEVDSATTPSTPSGGSTGGGGGVGPSLITVNIPGINGLTAPVVGQTPFNSITETVQYSGSVVWSPSHNSFAAETIYSATITLTAKSGYTFSGLTANFFTVTGSDSVSNATNSGVITAVFPATGSSGGNETPPSLTADITGNFVKTNLDILFTDYNTWRNAVSAVKVDGVPLTADIQYELIAGKLQLKTNAIQAMQVAGDYNVTIEATNYQAASVTQTVMTGLSGSGTITDPFKVASAEDLDKVRYYVGVSDLYFKQTADIDLNTIDWQPIGIYDQTMVTDGDPFMGNYDGNDYYIENMKINYSSPTYSYGAGLFRNTKEATLNNIKLKGVDIDVPNTGLVGALVGEAKETNITGCVVENSTKVKGLQAVGGLVGYAYQSTISSSRADVLVYGETSINIISNGIGGFVGDSHSSTITGSSAHGNVSGNKEVGGFAGRIDYASIIGCFSDGNVTGTGDFSQDTGGFVGINYHATADQCYAISAVSGRNYVGGFAGRNIGTITNSYARGSVAYTGAVAGGFVGRIQNNAANLLGGAPSDTGYNYSDVAISGTGTKIGAFLGEHDTSAPGGSGTIHYNHYNSEKATVNQGGGAIGLTFENMQKQDSFPEWDFSTIWTIQEDVTTPYHRWMTLSDNANLSSMSVVGQSMVPSFETDTISYDVQVATTIDAVDVSAVPAHNAATMTLNGTPLGMNSPLSIALGPEGTNTAVVIRVTAENGVTIKEYTVTVFREEQQTTTFTLTYTAGPNGSITGDTSQTITQGSDGTSVTAFPADGYEFINWSDESIENPRTDSNVTNNISVTANFVLIDDDPPVFSVDYPTVFSITDQEFRVGVAADKIGTAYYIVVADGATSPSSQQVKNRIDYGDVTVLRSGSMSLPIGEQPNSSSVLALQPNTDYDVYIVAESVGGALQSSPVKCDARTLELQAPQFFKIIIGDGNYPRVENIGGKQFDIQAGFNNKPGKVYYIVVPQDSTTPDTQQIIDGLDYDSVAISARGVFVIGVATQVYTETVTGLDPLTTYDIYLVAADNSIPMNINSKTEKLSASTLESNEPVFHDGSPFSWSIKEFGFTVGAGINKPGKLYMIVVNQNEESPTSEEVKDGFNYREVQVLAKASLEAPDPVTAYDIASITNLEQSTEYDVYVVAEDTSGTNIQASPTRLQVTTSDVSLGTEVSLSSGYPKTGSINNTTAEFTVKTNRRSNFYYMVIPSGMSVSKDNVVAGQVIGDSQSFGRHLHVSAGNFHTLPVEEYQITIEGLDPGKSYRLCYVAANGYDGYYDSAPVVSYVQFSTTGSSVPIVDLGITSQTETSFNLQVTSYSDAATAYYMVVTDGSIRPTFAQVKAAIGYEGVVPNATGNILLAESGYNYAEITGLTAASNYNVYVVVEDVSNPNLHTTTPYRLDASTTGLQPPVVYGPNIKLLGDTSFYLEVGITKAGSIYYILVPRDSSAPTSAQVKTGFDYSNVSVIKSDSIVVEAHDVKQYEISGLTPNTGFDLYVVAEADNVMHATPIKRQIQTNAPYVPIFSGNSPSIVNLRGDGLSITGTLENDADSIHYLIVPQGQVAPTSIQVKNPDSYTGTKSAYGSEQGISAAVRFTFDINGLDPNTPYDLYFVAEGTTGGLSTEPLKRSGTTFEALDFNEGPLVTNLRYYRLTLEGMLNRRGDVYHIVVPDSSNAPTTQQVIDGINYGNVTVISSGLVENALYYSNVYSGLEPNRSYDIYLVLKETHGGGSNPIKIQVTTPVIPGVAYSTNAESSPRAYISNKYSGVRLLVALNRPGTAYIARFSSDNLPTQQEVIDKAISGVYGVVIDINHPDILYGIIKDWSTISYKLYIVGCDNETPKNYITPSPQEITVLTE